MNRQFSLNQTDYCPSCSLDDVEFIEYFLRRADYKERVICSPCGDIFTFHVQISSAEASSSGM